MSEEASSKRELMVLVRWRVRLMKAMLIWWQVGLRRVSRWGEKARGEKGDRGNIYSTG